MSRTTVSRGPGSRWSGEWDVRFWCDENGVEPVRAFLKSLKRREDRAKKLAVATAIERILKVYGTDVCLSQWGKNLGRGLYEFRIRHTAEEIERLFVASEAEVGVSQPDSPSKILIRIFFMTSGKQIILLLSGYDKGSSPSPRREQEEIEKARRLVTHAKAMARE
jgi:putative component of toxin-antitoxin plasmid stabilization module